jgi:hypothetical protein
MNKLSIYTLKALRKLYIKSFGKIASKAECAQDPEKASQIIYDALMSDEPCMIARFGSNELNALINYQGVKYIINYLEGSEDLIKLNTNYDNLIKYDADVDKRHIKDYLHLLFASTKTSIALLREMLLVSELFQLVFPKLSIASNPICLRIFSHSSLFFSGLTDCRIESANSSGVTNFMKAVSP